MRKFLVIFLAITSFYFTAFGQAKIIIGIMPFTNTAKDVIYYNYHDYNQNYRTEDALPLLENLISDEFVQSKHFALVERSKMHLLKSEKNLQKSEDFIDGSVIEQSKSLGAQYLVMGGLTNVDVSNLRSHISAKRKASISYSVRVVDVTTGEIVASKSFSSDESGDDPVLGALNDTKPEIEKFIADNFKVVVSLVSVEAKDNAGSATKVLISAGSSINIKTGNQLNVFSTTQLQVDGKSMTRKISVGKLSVNSVEDENFSVCDVVEGGTEISKALGAGTKLKCELVNN